MDIIKTIKDNAYAYASMPFWSWNDKLEEEELRRQIRDMKRLGMSGFFMHARCGLETEYMSDEWFDCIKICIDEAKKQGMEAWAYDENGWPSGFAGGKLLQDKRKQAVGLHCEVVNAFPAEEDTLAVYTRNPDGTFNRVTEDCGAAEYYHIYRRYSNSYVDTLDGNITREFLELTHEEYKKRIPAEDFGKAMPGFFTDEPNYWREGKTYSNTMPEIFKKTYGYDMFPHLPALFYEYEGAEKFLFDYNKLAHDLFIANWIKPVYEWCENNGVQLTGHGWEEANLREQMMSVGGIMEFYEYEHIPGMDYLCRRLTNDIGPKQIGSACAQLGKKMVLSEMFACCGWDVSPRELKRIADIQYVGGVNRTCQHLYPYSERGQRKRDYPLHYSEHSPWQDSMVDFNTHYDHLGAALAQGEEYVSVLVIHPIHGAYMKYRRELDDILEIDGQMDKLSDLLGEHQIPYHYGDENLMKRYASVEGNRIRVGKCVYDYVVIPFTYSLDSETCAMLREYMAAGGKVWLFADTPAHIDGAKADMSWLKANISFEELLESRDIPIAGADGKNVPALRKMTRVLEDGSKLMLVTNLTADEQDGVAIFFPGAGTVAEIDIDTLEVRPVYGEKTAEGITVYANFDDTQSHMYSIDGEAAEILPGKPTRPAAYIPIPARAVFAEKPENMMTLDMVSLAKGDGEYDEPLSLYGVKDGLLREQYEGDIRLKYTFTAAEGFDPEKLDLVLEPMGQKSVTINGTEVQALPGACWFDRSFLVYPIGEYVKAGENEVVVTMHYYQRPYVYYVLYNADGGALRNSLTFDTEIECAYLVGDFSVITDAPFTPDIRNSLVYNGTFVLDSQKPDVRTDDVVQDGYTFFGGKLKLDIPYTWTPGAPTVLNLNGRFATCQIFVNGTYAGEMMFSRTMDLSAYLKEGENTIRFVMCNAWRNLMGPHHNLDPECTVLGPYEFTSENNWNGRECPDFLDRYSFVRYGLVM
ncbi:MAG: hypothetical protein IJ325_06950 [Clostridia bacterium]|nr:hypothetical protein [Clostridia bacterium]